METGEERKVKITEETKQHGCNQGNDETHPSNNIRFILSGVRTNGGALGGG
jgi:hypothetical protein